MRICFIFHLPWNSDLFCITLFSHPINTYHLFTVILSNQGLVTWPPHYLGAQKTVLFLLTLQFLLIPGIFIHNVFFFFTGYAWGIDIPSPGNSWTSKGTCNFLLDCIWNQPRDAHVTFTQKKGGGAHDSVTLCDWVDPWCLYIKSDHGNCLDHRVSSS